jgi:protoporphyrinogen/coproporphyrinogen III oxidase
MTRRVVVIGAGITGLTAAYRLRDHAEVTVLEASDRIGGKMLATPFDGRASVDAGGDMFLSRVPWALELCRELGIDGDLVSPATSKAYVAWDGKLHHIPDGLILGVPAGLSGLTRSALLSPAGKLRAAVEPLLPRSRSRTSDDCVGSLIRGRFGNEVAERLVDPLLGGINAGDCDDLSLAASAPQIATAAANRSLLLGLRAARPKGPMGPAFFAPRGGVGTMPHALAAHINDIRLNTPARSLVREGAGWRVITDTGDISADAVIVTSPAFATANLVRPIAPDAASLLAAIPFASVIMVTVAVSPADLTSPLDAAGILVPKPQQRDVTAVSFASVKWPHLAREGQVIVRASLGRHRDNALTERDDAAVLAATFRELERLIGLRATPSATRIVRWPKSFPQYTPGHLGRIRAVRSAVSGLGGLRLAGASFDGIGIPACIRQGNEAATGIAQWLTSL